MLKLWSQSEHAKSRRAIFITCSKRRQTETAIKCSNDQLSLSLTCTDCFEFHLGHIAFELLVCILLTHILKAKELVKLVIASLHCFGKMCFHQLFSFIKMSSLQILQSISTFQIKKNKGCLFFGFACCRVCWSFRPIQLRNDQQPPSSDICHVCSFHWALMKRLKGRPIHPLTFALIFAPINVWTEASFNAVNPFPPTQRSKYMSLLSRPSKIFKCNNRSFLFFF